MKFPHFALWVDEGQSIPEGYGVAYLERWGWRTTARTWCCWVPFNLILAFVVGPAVRVYDWVSLAPAFWPWTRARGVRAIKQVEKA